MYWREVRVNLKLLHAVEERLDIRFGGGRRIETVTTLWLITKSYR